MDMCKFDFDHSLEGMRRALEAELKWRSRFKCEAVRIESLGPLTVLTLPTKLPAEFLEVKEGWIVRGAYRDGEEWYAEVVDVDRHYPPTVVLTSDKEISENIVPECSFYETDFLHETKNWIKRKQNTSAGNATLPTKYISLTRSNYSESYQNNYIHDDLANTALRPAQKKAVNLVQKTFGIIWGPPGTGKTYTLGSMVNKLRSERERILVMAPTNVAADCAVLSIDQGANAIGMPIEAGELIRPGFPQLAALESLPHLMAWNEHLEAMRQNLSLTSSERQAWEKVRKQKSGRDRKYLQQSIAKLKLTERTVKIDRSRAFWNAAPHAKIIVTTLHSAMNNEEALSDIVDEELNIILDEAGMIPRFMLARIMDLKPKKLYLFGDFKQLGPVRTNQNKQDQNSAKWIADSAFSAVGLDSVELAEQMEKRGTLVMLTQQSRMRAELCEKVSDVFYAGKLEAIDIRETVFPLSKQPHSGVVIIDPDEWFELMKNVMPELPEQEKTKNHCEKSVLSAVGISSALLEADKKASTLLLSPFRNQASALFRYSNSVLVPYEGRWKAGTVHLSQGQESDYVIFSPVNPSHAWLRGRFGSEELERLLCVAFSRARTQVIVVVRPSEISRSPLLKRLCDDAQVWAAS